MTTRRRFMQWSGGAGLASLGGRAAGQAAPVDPSVPGSTAPAATTPAPAPAAPAATTVTPAAPVGPLVSETEPQAVAVGYVADARRANLARFPRFHRGQHCAACQQYQGLPSAPTAPCTVFAGRQVQASGWCSSFRLRTG